MFRSHDEWIIYPEAIKKLDASGISARIEKAVKSEEFSPIGIRFDDQITRDIKAMKDAGLLNQIPKKERKEFKKLINDGFVNKDKIKWVIERTDGKEKESVATADFLFFSGFASIDLLRKNELFNYKKFGFSNILEFTGTTGAAFEMALSGSPILDRTPVWASQRPDGRIITSAITGDTNGDLRIYQNDITAYPTTDPFGNKVSYRPQTDSDRMAVAAYHSTEGSLLVAVLKYVDQLKLKTETLDNNAKETLKWARSLGQHGGTCAEHFGGFDQSPILFFAGWPVNIPLLDEKYNAKEGSPYGVVTLGSNPYNIYIGPSKELVIAEKSEPNKGKKSVTFMPEDMDNVIKGIVYQAAAGLGRTSVNQIIDILEYRFSPKLEEDQIRIK